MGEGKKGKWRGKGKGMGVLSGGRAPVFIDLRERGREERNSNKKHLSIASCTPPTGGPAGNLGMCPNLELNL